MSEKKVLVSKEDGVATITLNRPKKMNAFDMEMNLLIAAAVTDVAGDPEVRVAIVTGAGKAFCTGADVTFLSGTTGRREFPSGVMSDIIGGGGSVNAAVVKMQNMQKPVIAAINGIAAGGGLSLALGCDIRIASEDAKFTFVFVKRGLIPEAGGTFNLPRLVGIAKACELVLTGDIITAREAERIGLVNKVVPAGELMEAARDMATKIAQNPPLAVRLAKAALYRGLAETNVAAQIDLENYTFKMLSGTEDFQEGVQSFLEKRAPVFKGK